MNRREFCVSAVALTTGTVFSGLAQLPEQENGFPANVLKNDYYIEKTPIAGYRWAPPSAYEAFQDMKFGIRIHWGIYSIWHRGAESWPFSAKCRLPTARRTTVSTKPGILRASMPDGWMDTFQESGMKMFTLTTKHHEGFSLFDTKTQG